MPYHNHRFECVECRKTVNRWTQTVRAPKRCGDCAQAIKHKKQSSRTIKQKKAENFDKIIRLVETRGIEAFDEICVLVETWKSQNK